jgi:molybdate transport system substrate-binding protein
MTVRRAGAVIAVGALLALAGCGPSVTPVGGTTSADPLSGEVTVFAAASLEPVLDEVAAAFTAAHPEVRVAAITYDGSATLATQLVEGATADVLATADRASVQAVVDGGLADGSPVVFTTNVLQIVVPAGNPARIATLADLGALAHGGGKVVVCAPQVPCGSAAQRALDAAHVDLAPASLEQNVTAVLTKVQTGEADAGLVYRTDVLKGGADIEGVDLPAQAVNEYPAVALAGARNPAAARAFVTFLTTAAAQDLLAERGFSAP